MEIIRQFYLEQLKKHQDKRIIKIVSGIRRCGKSTLLKQFADFLYESGVKKEQVIYLNLDDIGLEFLDYKQLHQYISDRLFKEGISYIFLDEVQNIAEFQKAVNSLFLKDNVDIYITGSNAHLLSGEFSTLLTGRFVEIQMLPLSFKEYFGARGGEAKMCFDDYLKYTSFPYAADISDIDEINDYLKGIYSSVLLKDTAQRNKISDLTLLENIVKFLFDNIGNIVSSKKISDFLSSAGRKTSPATVENYIQALCGSFILYKCQRYDIKGKQYLKSLEKYYLADFGFRRILLGNRNLDFGRVLENAVYLELLRRGNRVNIGKVNNLEIDFISQSAKEIIYYQVCQNLQNEETLLRELNPLKAIKDNYRKFIITADDPERSIDGIEIKNIIDFLLGE
ncbi:MAG: ATP-binding protein [Elusimicrobiota bacterium]|jgi:predicted AAA+ superfamily ATPase|nr:ATP-binding protein [Elusimicrobiota bacterium]